MFKVKRSDVFTAERLVYADFMEGNTDEVRPYVFVPELKDFQAKMDEYLEDYNSATKNPMKLVMFLDACEHVARICRVLRQPKGNAFLLGVGGSGRQSLTKLATSIT